MTIWILFALMTGAAVMAVLWPLSRRADAGEAGEASETFYRQQLAEVERDRERGLLTDAEAEAARAEAGRRLLRAASAQASRPDAVGEPALRRRRAASTLALSIVPLLALAIYGAAGSPNLPDQPLAARQGAEPAASNLAAMVARIEAHLAATPDDGRGWEVIAPVYLRGGRAEDAARAYGNAVRLLGETAPRLADWGEALVTAQDGVVTAEARTALERAVRLDPTSPKARFYLAVAAEQDGDVAGARARLSEIVAGAPADAPWLSVVRERLAKLEGGGAAASVAALPEAERRGAIQGMVEGLAARLATGGGTAEEWSRLVRSYAVLGEKPKAEAALKTARAALGADSGARATLDALARDLGLEPPAQ